MLTFTRHYADISEFESEKTKVLYGTRLAAIKALEVSILQTGLLTPLSVVQGHQSLIVIDGHKRLMAIRRLAFLGMLPENLKRIPYVKLDQNREPHVRDVGDARRYLQVRLLQKRGYNLSAISQKLGVTKERVRRLTALNKLSPKLKKAFVSSKLSYSQAKALSSISDHKVQETLLSKLGSFSREKDVLKAVGQGATLLPVDNESVIILPPRAASQAEMGFSTVV